MVDFEGQMSEPGQPQKAMTRQLWALSVTSERTDGIVVLAVNGRLGTASSEAMVEALSREIRAGYLRLLVDLTGVDYVSSAGLGALEAIARRVRESRGELVLCALSEPVRLVFDLAGLLSAFAIEPSREAGLNRLRRETL
jgi:stage II sporulation protein AA (anti-sigma F factor antagonist)